ncbi:hypothetical protein DMUE_2584 [Dictyocoela muelleri]|nr:hypothetical protein DMUE_2584 [Dictyocoela muelleri]
MNNAINTGIKIEIIFTIMNDNIKDKISIKISIMKIFECRILLISSKNNPVFPKKFEEICKKFITFVISIELINIEIIILMEIILEFVPMMPMYKLLNKYNVCKIILELDMSIFFMIDSIS